MRDRLPTFEEALKNTDSRLFWAVLMRNSNGFTRVITVYEKQQEADNLVLSHRKAYSGKKFISKKIEATSIFGAYKAIQVPVDKANLKSTGSVSEVLNPKVAL